jgi:hypothetical protein
MRLKIKMPYKTLEEAIEKFDLHPPHDCPFYWEDGLGNENCKAEGCECWFDINQGCSHYNEMMGICLEEDD